MFVCVSVKVSSVTPTTNKTSPAALISLLCVPDIMFVTHPPEASCRPGVKRPATLPLPSRCDRARGLIVISSLFTTRGRWRCRCEPAYALPRVCPLRAGVTPGAADCVLTSSGDIRPLRYQIEGLSCQRHHSCVPSRRGRNPDSVRPIGVVHTRTIFSVCQPLFLSFSMLLKIFF